MTKDEIFSLIYDVFPDELQTILRNALCAGEITASDIEEEFGLPIEKVVLPEIHRDTFRV